MTLEAESMTTTAPAATPAWPVFEAALLSRQLVAEGTMAFRFEKPDGWSYRAGQFVDITLLSPPETDAEGNTRGFSIASAPSEGVIMIATRLRDTTFKRVLQTVPLGTQVRIEGPFGDLRLHHAARPAVILTGGIGITPFRSILLEAIHEGGLPYRVVLFYANRRPQDAPFLEELRSLASRDPNLTIVPTMSAIENAIESWEGELGHIDTAMLDRHLGDVAEPIHYLTGPPGMVAALRSMLVARGIDEDDIRTEEFTGY
jgi:ferredoxin-NADP reductase